MYYTNDDLIASVEGLIGKLEDSLIKSRIEKWVKEVEVLGRITSEQLENFMSFATHLPKEVQSYPSAFVMWVKNGDRTLLDEEAQGTEETAELGTLVDDSISDVPDVDAPDDEEETLHGDEDKAVKRQKRANKTTKIKLKTKAKSK